MATGGGALENIKEEENYQMQDHLGNPHDRDAALSPSSAHQPLQPNNLRSPKKSGKSSMQPSSRANRAAVVSPAEHHSYESEYDEEYDPSSSEQTI